mgnify:CR=1 FL=1
MMQVPQNPEATNEEALVRLEGLRNLQLVKSITGKVRRNRQKGQKFEAKRDARKANVKA